MPFRNHVIGNVENALNVVDAIDTVNTEITINRTKAVGVF